MSYFGIVAEGHVLDVPNAALGVLYYLYTLLLISKMPILVTQIAASAALSSTIFLALKLTQLKELCILCWTTHVINALLWWKTVGLATASNAQQQDQKEKKS